MTRVETDYLQAPAIFELIGVKGGSSSLLTTVSDSRDL